MSYRALLTSRQKCWATKKAGACGSRNALVIHCGPRTKELRALDCRIAESQQQRRQLRQRQKQTARRDGCRAERRLGGRRPSCGFKLMKTLQKARGVALGDWRWGAKLGGSGKLSGSVAQRPCEVWEVGRMRGGRWQLNSREQAWRHGSLFQTLARMITTLCPLVYLRMLPMQGP